MLRAMSLITVMVGLAVSLLFGASAAHAAPPSNDAYSAATVITQLPFSDVVNIGEATSSPGDPLNCFPGQPTVWYAFTPSTDSRINVNTLGSDFDPTLTVVTGSPGAFNLIACNDDFIDLQSSIFFDAQAGVTYYIVGGPCCGEGGQGGTLHLNVQAVPALAAQVSVDRRGTALRDGTAIVTVTVSCNQPITDGFISVGLRQLFANRVAIDGNGGDVVDCSPPSSTFRITVVPFNGRFSAGKAQASALWSGCSPLGDCFEVSATQELILSKGR